MTLSRIGGMAALLCAGTYLFGFALLVTRLAPLGYGTAGINAPAVAAFIHAQPGVLIVFNSVIYILNAAALVVLVAALAHWLGPMMPEWSAVTRGFGLIWAALVLAAGMIANVAVERTAALYPDDPAGAAELWSVLHAVELGLGGGNEIAGGVWIGSVSMVGLSGHRIARPVAILGMLTSLAGAATVVSGLGDAAGAIFGLGAIVWFIAVGALLLSPPRPRNGSTRGIVSRPGH